MAKSKSKDLFDDSTMSFGEHLEVLRTHLWKAIIGLAVSVVIALFFGNYVIVLVSAPINRALAQYGVEAEQDVKQVNWWDKITSYFGEGGAEEPAPNAAEQGKSLEAPPSPASNTAVTTKESPAEGTITVHVRPSDLIRVLHQADPERYPAPQEVPDETTVPLTLSSSSFQRFEETAINLRKPVTLNVQEAFLVYVKVAFIAGFVLASPWIFYQLWLFVAAGLYPHERRYVHVYLPVSVTLFIGGAVFCFFVVFPFVLKFLLTFNEWMGLQPQIRMSEWISFAISLPLMFGIGFQLPLVMLFLERISIFEVDDYRRKRRMAILVISILSMLLTPPDPMSMVLMMMPLMGLYELGIWMCGFSPAKSPFDEAEAI